MPDSSPNSPALDSLRAKLEAQAVAAGQRWVVLLLDEAAQTVPVAGKPGAVLVDPAGPRLLAELIASGALALDSLPRVTELARLAATRGVVLREQQDLWQAWLHQRFAAAVAAHIGSGNGMRATTANLWVIREALRNHSERGVAPIPVRVSAQGLQQLAHGLRGDAAQLVQSALAAGDGVDLLTVHRLACIAGDAALAVQCRQQLEAGGDAAADAAALAAAEALAEFDTEDLMAELPGLGEREAVVRRVERDAQGDLCETPVEHDAATSAWAAYQRCRHRFVSTDRLADGQRALRAAFAQLAHVRLRTTAAGGAFGHRLSYLVSTMLQPVGRDLAMLQLRAGTPDSALASAESLLARAMSDWMCRTHALWAVPRAFIGPGAPLTGAVNAVEPAGLGEIGAAAAQWGPLLYLMRLQDGHVVWLVRRDGTLVCERLPDMAAALNASRALFPRLSSGRGVRAIGRIMPLRTGRAARDKLLQRLHEALFVPALREALNGQGEQLVFIADTDFAHVPWSALRSADGRYLVQDLQLEQWPSVTARLVIDAGARIPTWQRARRDGPVAPLVMGLSDFSNLELMIDDGPPLELQPLRGAESEAQAVAASLRARLVLNSKATVARLLDDAQGAEIVHLASHGVLDEAAPERSLVILADGCITAGELYQLDRGLRCGLIVLSACQTGLGGSHPDSAIGLANAFLIAGAQAVLGTLWKVPDDATRQLMESFYRAMAGGASTAAALRSAQLEALAEPARADPFCWAAPALTGSGSARFAITAER